MSAQEYERQPGNTLTWIGCTASMCVSAWGWGFRIPSTKQPGEGTGKMARFDPEPKVVLLFMLNNWRRNSFECSPDLLRFGPN